MLAIHRYVKADNKNVKNYLSIGDYMDDQYYKSFQLIVLSELKILLNLAKISQKSTMKIAI